VEISCAGTAFAQRGINMKTQRLLMSSFAVVVAGVAACSDDTMSMTEEIDRVASQQAALELELSGHHRDVLDAGDMPRIRSFEGRFGQSAATHMDEMDHGMRDMQVMCSMGNRRFDGGSMSRAMNRIRDSITEHRQRMDAIADLAAMHAEEDAFRESTVAPMADMRAGQSDARRSSVGYTCRMHGH
jgi:hypothetical protein